MRTDRENKARVKTFLAWLRLPAATRARALEAALALLLARLLVECVPMRYWRHCLDTAPEPAGATESRADAQRLAQTLARIVRKVARRAPFRAKCLPRAMTAQWMLRRRGLGSRLVFGARRGEVATRALQYHAWLIVAGECVIGGREAETYAVLPPFPDRDGRERSRSGRIAGRSAGGGSR